MKKTAVIILSAGTGTRLKSQASKPFVLIENKPLIVHTVKNLQKALPEATFFIACNPPEIPLMIATLEKHRIGGLHLTPGGQHRAESLFNVLALLDKTSFKTILVHDGARPFIDRDLVMRVFAGLKKADCCIPAMPVRYTIKLIDGERIKTLDRKSLFEIQTPQAFKAAALLKAFRIVQKRKRYPSLFYDDAQLIECTHGSIRTVEGSPHNIKITYPADLIIARQFLKTWQP